MNPGQKLETWQMFLSCCIIVLIMFKFALTYVSLIKIQLDDNLRALQKLPDFKTYNYANQWHIAMYKYTAFLKTD